VWRGEGGRRRCGEVREGGGGVEREEEVWRGEGGRRRRCGEVREEV
jgi:hypothetical protein